MAFPILGWAILAGAALLAAQHKAVSTSNQQQNNNAPFTPPNDSDVLSGGSVAPVVGLPSTAPTAQVTAVPRDFVITPAPMRFRDTDPIFAAPAPVSTGASLPLAHEMPATRVQDPLRFRALTQA